MFAVADVPWPGRDQVAAMLERVTLKPGVNEGTFLFQSGQDVILLEGVRRSAGNQPWTPERLERIEAVLRTLDPDPLARSVEDVAKDLLDFTRSHLERVSHPRWLKEPLGEFRRLLDSIEFRESVVLPRIVLEAAFVAFLTTP